MEMRACPPTTRSYKKERKETDQASEVLKRMSRNHRGRILLPFRNSLSLLKQAGSMGLPAGMKLTELTRNLFYFHCLWWFQGAGEVVLFWVSLGFLNLVHFSFLCLKENWSSLNSNRIRLIFI